MNTASEVSSASPLSATTVRRVRRVGRSLGAAAATRASDSPFGIYWPPRMPSVGAAAMRAADAPE